MGAKSSVAQLEKPIKEAVDEAIREGRASIDEIVSMIHEMGGDASRSAVGRYKLSFEKGMEVFQASQKMAEVWGKKLGEEPEGKVAQLTRAVLGSVALRTAQGMAASGDAVPASELHFLAKGLAHLAQAETLEQKRVLEIRKEMARQAADVAKAEVKAAGLSDEAADAIRAKILGVV